MSGLRQGIGRPTARRWLIGIPWARTGVWGLSVVGLVMIFMQVV